MSEQTMESIFGPVISAYTRQQAIEDGELVDISTADGCKGFFKYPVAMSRAAWTAAVEAGGQWVTAVDDEELQLPGGQSVAGRLHDVCWMLKIAIRKAGRAPGSETLFGVLVDEKGNGRHKRVDLWALCGPGDNREPVITIMVQGED
jgi:hypothetical protein